MAAFSSVFGQLLKIFPRSEFELLVKETKAERHGRGFSCWQQFVSMLFCQLGRAQSLREICDGLASMEGKLNHLGVATAPKKSTLAYANEHRPARLFERIFYQLYQRCREVAPNHRFRFKNPLLSIDATVIELCADVFEWARYTRTKGAVKLHMILDHSGLLPSFCHITEAKQYDVVVAREWEFAPGTVLVFDRGYTDFSWFKRLDEQGVFFVTRLKRGSRYSVTREREVPPESGVKRDVEIRLENRRLRGESPTFRLIEYQADDGKVYEFLTNQLEFDAITIAQIYQQRWEIEVFFKALKQNLRIKTFVGTSANALRIQVWSALIAMLMIRFLKFKSSYGWSLSNLIAMLRFNLFSYRDLWSWLNDPFASPPHPDPTQLSIWTAFQGASS